MQRPIFVVAIAIIFLSCGHNSKDNKMAGIKLNDVKNDSLIFITIFQPSFTEYSTIKLIKIGTVQTLEILIKNNYKIDKTQDTFYYKKIKISKDQFDKIDTSLIQKTKIKYEEKHNVGFDGMSILFQSVNKSDTILIRFWSPDKNDEIFGYTLTKASIENFKACFNDAIIADYLDDVETYIDESKVQTLFKKKRVIDKLRAKKYHKFVHSVL